MSLQTVITGLSPTAYWTFVGDTPLAPSVSALRPNAFGAPILASSGGPVAKGAGLGYLGLRSANLNYLDFGNRGLDSAVVGASAVTFVAAMRRVAGNTLASSSANNVLWKTISGTSSGLNLNFTDGERLRIGGRSVSTDGFQSAICTNPLPLDSWVLVVAEWGFSTDTLKLWVDNVQEVNAGVAFIAASYSQSSTSRNDLIGASTVDATNCPDVDLAHVAFFSRALNSTERSDLFAAWDDRPSVSGVVYDDTGTAAARDLFVIDRATGVLLGSGTSDGGTGAYSISVPSSGEVIVIAKDDAAGTQYNDLVHRVLP